MRITFKNRRLEAIRNSETSNLGLPESVVLSFRRKIVVLEAAPDERTLRNWKSLHYEKLEGKREGQRSIRLNENWRIVFKIDDSTSPPMIVVLGVEDYH